ncbi:MAG TPA: cyclic nucleotide-binding domain-containing protein [Methylococcaceae bacterium]|nr:cyclic nucleotide-binding domain-containing protein [Methylococcaceae bacterium]
MQVQDIDFRMFARSAGTALAFKKGEIIFQRGDAADAIWIVLSGTVEVEYGNQMIDVVGVNYAIGILSLVDNEKRSATARALEACELIRLDHAQFRFMFEEMPNFGWYAMRQLASRLRSIHAVL